MQIEYKQSSALKRRLLMDEYTRSVPEERLLLEVEP